MYDKDDFIGIAMVIGAVLAVLFVIYLFIALCIGWGNANTLSNYCSYEDGRPYSDNPKPTGRYWISNPMTLGTTGTCEEKR